MRAHENFLLARLDAAAFEELERHGSTVALSSGVVIVEAYSELDKVYFPHSGIISCMVALAGGGVIETAMIGRDGVFGAAIALNSKRVVNPALVQVSGTATVFDARIFAETVEKHPALRRLVLAYEHFHLSEVQQTAACNAVHTVRARTCRWILRMYDLIGNEIAITQEALAQMMGIRRTSVTEVAKELQGEGVISITRGRMQILDVSKVADYACECHADVANIYSNLCR